jgi:hypothetical protein
MGRAHYPGLWRVLDRQANRLDHVRWAEVTQRGYGILELTPAAARMHWIFVDPYADDPAGEAFPAASFRTDRDPWPPDLVPDELTDEPDRRDRPDALPARPADLRRLRVRRRFRLAAEAAGWTVAVAVAVVGPVALGVAAVRRVRRVLADG